MCPLCPVCGIVRGCSMAVGHTYRADVGERFVRRCTIHVLSPPKGQTLPRLPRVDVTTREPQCHATGTLAFANVLRYSSLVGISCFDHKFGALCAWSMRVSCRWRLLEIPEDSSDLRCYSVSARVCRFSETRFEKRCLNFRNPILNSGIVCER